MARDFKKEFKERAFLSKKGATTTSSYDGEVKNVSDFRRGLYCGINRQIVAQMDAKKKLADFKKANPNYVRKTK